MKHVKIGLAAASCCALMLAAGCTRSIEYVYQSEMKPLSDAGKLSGVTVGIAKFDDKRSWLEPGNEKSASFIAQQGTWKFGLDHKGQNFAPVARIVQDIFVDEFGRAGIKAKAIDEVVSKKNQNVAKSVGEKSGVDYVIGGEITVFEFVNETGVWTVTARQSVILSVLLQSARDSRVLMDENFAESNRKNEGVGVAHTTNVEKLMNGAFKTVVQNVIERTASKLALGPEQVRVKVAYDAKVYEYTWEANQVSLVSK